MRRFFSYGLVLVWVSFGVPAEALLDFLSSPCGCSRLKAGKDVASIHQSSLAAEEHFKQCLECKDIRKVSDIMPYLNAFLRQLPESQYEEYAHLLHTLRFGKSRYDNVLNEADLKSSDKRIHEFLEILKRGIKPINHMAAPALSHRSRGA